MSKKVVLGELAAVAFVVFFFWYEGWPWFDAMAAADPKNARFFMLFKVITTALPAALLPVSILMGARKKEKKVERERPVEIPEFGFGYGFIRKEFEKVFEEAIRQGAMALVPEHVYKAGEPASITLKGKVEGQSLPMTIKGARFAFVGSGRDITIRLDTGRPKEKELKEGGGLHG